MDTPTQPSFIPHDAAMPSMSLRREGGSGLAELFLLVSILFLVISGALAGGVFLYTQYLQTSSASKLAQLNTAEAAFDPSLVQQFTRLDDRMKTAQALLSAHLAPTQIFTMLEQTTAQDISFSTLVYDASDPTQITVKMTGIAGSVNSVALQAQLFSQSGVITSPIFSDIDREPDGVHFDFTALLNPTAINYESFVTGTVATGTQAQVQTQTQPAPSPFTSSSTPAAGSGKPAAGE